MTSLKVDIDQREIKWLKEQYQEMILKESGIKPTNDVLLRIALNHLRSYIYGVAYNISYSKLRKCWIIKKL